MSSRNAELTYGLSNDVIRKDLTDERPPWILSAYGPGKDAPEQLIGGYPREQSFEEIRWLYEQEAAKGNSQGALNEINGIYQNAEQQIQTVLNDLGGAVQFLVDAANRHPNRLDVCKQSVQQIGGFKAPEHNNALSNTNAFGQPAQSPSPFGAAAAQSAAPSAFGQPSALGQRPNPFGAAPAFGQPAQLGNKPAFGQPAFGQPSQPTSTFGTPSVMGAKPNPFGAPAFGQPAQPTPTTSTFGQPSQMGGNAFGQPSQMGATAFGQPSQMGGGSAFGQPSVLGQKPNPFGASSNTTQPLGGSPFGQAAATANQSPFGQAAAAAAATTNQSPFGQAAAAMNQSPFGQAAATNQSPFGAFSGARAAPTPSNPFGSASTNAAGQSATPNNSSPFGQPQPSNGLGAFGQPQQTTGPSPFGRSPANATPFGLAQPGQKMSSPFGQAMSSQTAQGAAPSTEQSYGVKGPDGRLRTFKGRPVVYQVLKEGTPEVPVIAAFDGSIIKIWFPDGPTPYNPDTELLDRSLYEVEKVKAQWRTFMETEKFAGTMPSVPPKREWCKWGF